MAFDLSLKGKQGFGKSETLRRLLTRVYAKLTGTLEGLCRGGDRQSVQGKE